MAFIFPLQSLLNWKKSLEEIAQMAVAVQNKKLQALEDEILRRQQQRLFYEQELRAQSQRGMEGARFLVYRRYAERCVRDLQARIDERERTRKEVEKAVQELMERTKERKVLEKLKEKKLKGFFQILEKTEQKNADERTLQNYQPPLK